MHHILGIKEFGKRQLEAPFRRERGYSTRRFLVFMLGTLKLAAGLFFDVGLNFTDGAATGEP